MNIIYIIYIKFSCWDIEQRNPDYKELPDLGLLCLQKF